MHDRVKTTDWQSFSADKQILAEYHDTAETYKKDDLFDHIYHIENCYLTDLNNDPTSNVENLLLFIQCFVIFKHLKINSSFATCLMTSNVPSSAFKNKPDISNYYNY